MWEIPKFWEFLGILGIFGKFWEIWKIRQKTAHRDFLMLRDGRDCAQMGANMFLIFFPAQNTV
jgi:hypothetical protein